MIKIANFFKNKRKTFMIIGILCIIGLAAAILINGKSAPANNTVKNDIQSIINTFTVNEDSISPKTIDLFDYIGFKSNDIQKMRIDFFDRDNPKYLDISDKAIITDFLNELNTIKILPYLQEDNSTNPIDRVYILLDCRGINVPLFIDYKTGGIAKYAIVMSSLPKFEYRFEDTKKLKKIIDEVFSKLPNNPQIIEQAVSQAILEQHSKYLDGEAATEGHIILETEEKNGKVKAYTVSSFSWFGFENGVFTTVSGSGAIPTVMTFSKNEKGQYLLLEYKEPLDGAMNVKSTKEMFPKKLWNEVLSGDKYYSELVKQEEAQAAKYLEDIGRKAEVSHKYVERKLPKINVEASNKLFAEFTKYNSELNKFPYWLGTREQLENGLRYIYETSQNKTSDGYDLIVFKKTKQDGTLVKEYRYKIVGSEPKLME
ncbi:MAG: hypothetical protein ACM3UU_08025 [Ignavibacteriales bacterium]